MSKKVSDESFKKEQENKESSEITENEENAADPKSVDLDQSLKEERSDEKTLKLEKEDNAKKDELEEMKKKYFYLLAESDNARKRFDREKEGLIKYGNEKILSSLVEVLDNFDHSLDALKDETEEKIKNIFTGMEMIRKQFLSKLSGNGLTRIEALGEKFDPKFHEAMCEQVDETKEAGTILTEYKKGYLLNGRLLRASKVVVAKKADA